MESVKTIELKIVNKYNLHRVVYDTADPSFGSAYEEPETNISMNFDYERRPQSEWLFHADAGYEVIPFGKVYTRTTFQITAAEHELFSVEILRPIVEEAIQIAKGSYKEFARENNFPKQGVILHMKQLTLSLVTSIITNYKLRTIQDKNNEFLETKYGLRLTPGGNTSLIVTGTFMIMDHILYENPAFNNESNREAIMEYVPLPRYETIKLKCLEIDRQNVSLTWVETIFFFLCLDCALQLLLGEHADTLIPQMEELGMIELRRNEYVAFSSDMVKGLKTTLKEGGMTISNLEQQIDWNSLMK